VPREVGSILRKYPVIYKPVGSEFRVEYHNKRVEELAGGRDPRRLQAVKDDVKAQLLRELAGKVTLSDAPRGFVVDFALL